MNKKTCVITGATGLIGSGLVDVLERDYEIHAVARTPGPRRSGVHWHSIDLATDCRLDTLPRRVDGVVYLAQSEFFRDFPQHGPDVFQVNTVNLLRFLDYAWKAGASHFVYASSGGVYGSGDVRMSEDIQIPAHGGLGFYLSTKLSAEIIAKNYSSFFNFVSLRFFFVYGPAQRKSMLIPRLIQRVRDGQPLLLQGLDGIRLNPTHVSDAAAATRCALEIEGSHIINVGGPDILNMREIGTMIGHFVGKSPIFDIDEKSQPGHLIADIDKMSSLLVYPKMGFSDGLRTML